MTLVPERGLNAPQECGPPSPFHSAGSELSASPHMSSPEEHCYLSAPCEDDSGHPETSAQQMHCSGDEVPVRQDAGAMHWWLACLQEEMSGQGQRLYSQSASESDMEDDSQMMQWRLRIQDIQKEIEQAEKENWISSSAATSIDAQLDGSGCACGQCVQVGLTPLLSIVNGPSQQADWVVCLTLKAVRSACDAAFLHLVACSNSGLLCAM